MAGEEAQLIRLKDDFYRDGFYGALAALGIVLVAICLLVALSIYLIWSKPAPVIFATGNDFRILPLVPVDQSYIKQPDLIQWVSNAVPAAFTYDFSTYQQDLNKSMQYFTENGWKNFAAVLNLYANGDNIQTNKIFINAEPAGAPIIQNEGLLKEEGLNGVYGWWIQMPLNLSYSNGSKTSVTPLVVQVLVVRVPTVNNIDGVAIEKVVVAKGSEDQVIKNG